MYFPAMFRCRGAGMAELILNTVGNFWDKYGEKQDRQQQLFSTAHIPDVSSIIFANCISQYSLVKL